MRRLLPAALALALATLPAHAQSGPEQLDQIEPGQGSWQAEYFGTFGDDGEQGIELLYGLSDRIALGVEAEFEGPADGLRFDSIAPILLIRLADPETAALGFGVKLQGAISRSGELEAVEARGIVEHRGDRWWLQGDAIVRHARDDGASGTGLAYAVSIQRALADDVWFGIEASGQAARLRGHAELAPTGAHYAGPSLTAELPLGAAEVELGLAWLQRVAGDGPASGPRIFAQFTF